MTGFEDKTSSNNEAAVRRIALTAEEAKNGCEKTIMVNNQPHTVKIDPGIKVGDRITLKSNNNYVFCIVEISRIIGENISDEKNETLGDKKEPTHNTNAKKRTVIAAISALLLIAIVSSIIYHDRKLLSDAVLSTDHIEMGINATRTLKVENISDKTKIKWKSSDSSIASVDENGVITTHKFGEAVISASTGLNIHKLECKVYSRRAEINMDEEMYTGNTYTLTLEHTDAQNVKWLSFDNSIAEVTASSKDPRKAKLTIHQCGPVMIGANVDGDLVVRKPSIKMQEKNVIEIESDRIHAFGNNVTFWVAYSFTNDLEFGMLWTDYMGGPSYHIEELGGDVKQVTILDVPEKSRMLEIFAGDSEGYIRDDLVSRKYLTVDP